MELSLTTIGSEIPVVLPPMIQGREYSLDVTVVNKSSMTITPTNLLLSCGCTAATSQTKKAIPPGSPLTIRLQFKNLKIPHLDTSVQSTGQNESDVLFTLRIRSAIQSPLKIAIPNITLEKGQSGTNVPFRIQGISPEIDLENASIAIFGDWVNSVAFDEYSNDEQKGTIQIEVPNSLNSYQSEMLIRVTYLDRGSITLGEWSFPIRKKTPLATRMQHLLIDFTGSNEAEIKLLLFGDFNPDNQVFVRIMYCSDILYEGPMLPSNSRMLLLKALICKSAFKMKDGEIIVFANDEKIVLPFTITGD